MLLETLESSNIRKYLREFSAQKEDFKELAVEVIKSSWQNFGKELEKVFKKD